MQQMMTIHPTFLVHTKPPWVTRAMHAILDPLTRIHTAIALTRRQAKHALFFGKVSIGPRKRFEILNQILNN